MITKERHEKLRKDLAVFPLSMLQDFLTFAAHCHQQEIEISEIRGFIQAEIEDDYIVAERTFARQESIKKIVAEKVPYCPICNSQLALEPVNDHPGRVIDDHSKCWWVCPRKLCDFDPILNDREPWRVMGDLGIPVHQIPKTMTPQKRAKRMRAAGRQRGCGQRG